MADQVIYPSSLSVDTVQKMALGSIIEDGAGNELIYLQGVAGTVRGSCVSFVPGTYLTTLGAGAAAGRLAFAMAPVLANQFGFYMVKGEAPCVTAGTTVVGAAAFLAAAGAVDDAVVATDRIEGTYFTTTTTGTGKVLTVYPQALGLG